MYVAVRHYELVTLAVLQGLLLLLLMLPLRQLLLKRQVSALLGGQLALTQMQLCVASYCILLLHHCCRPAVL